jgi:hypothetical protein
LQASSVSQHLLHVRGTVSIELGLLMAVKTFHTPRTWLGARNPQPPLELRPCHFHSALRSVAARGEGMPGGARATCRVIPGLGPVFRRFGAPPHVVHQKNKPAAVS